MNDVLLALDKLDYSYDDGSFSLKGLSLEIRKGQRIAVLGNNGAGKSTFFLLCNGILKPDKGTLAYGGKTIDPRKKQDLMGLRQLVGIIFQDADHQIIGSTVESEVSFGPMNLKLPLEEVAQRVDQALQAMGLTEYRHRPPHYLSGGEKKRVTIADILAMKPEILLFDEPTAFLDPDGVRTLEGLLAELHQQERALLVSTHDIDFAWRWAQRILVFHDGQLLADNTPEQIFADGPLLERAGLRRPYLYDFTLSLQAHFGWPPDVWPRTTAEIEAYFKVNSANASSR